MATTPRHAVAQPLLAVLALFAMGIGLLFLLVGLVSLTSAQPTFRPWVAINAGVLLLGAGAAVFASIVATIVRKLVAWRRRARHPREPWLWGPKPVTRIADDGGGEFARIAITLAVWGALAPLLSSLGPQLAGDMHLLFDIFLFAGAAGVVGRALYLLLRRLRYGRSVITVGQAPLFLGERIGVRLLPNRRLASLEKIRATLRCVQERIVTTSSGHRSTTEVVCYEVWSDTLAVDARGVHDGQSLSLEFTLPDDGETYTTRLHESPPRYWQLELSSAVPGIDYAATFLIPVYARAP